MTAQIVVVHGPNLNLLGEREPEIYGRLVLRDINRRIRTAAAASKPGARLRFYQSNHEGEIIDFLQGQRRWADGILINPAAYTHYSYAIRDAIAGIDLPAIEVHLSDIKKREPFRRKSVIAPVCLAQVSGLGWKSYTVALEKLLAHLAKTGPKRSK
jgi:3-dehydroquinate dehydratase-2